SARNASISSGLGGSPVRSNVARRISVRLSAGGRGLRLLFSNLAKMKLSTGPRGQFFFLIPGGGELRSGRKAQCLELGTRNAELGTGAPRGSGAPMRTQVSRSPICEAGRIS